MLTKIGSTTLTVKPKEFSVKIMDIDNQETTTRTADGKLHRDRITTKRQIEVEYNILTTAQISALLQLMSAASFTIEYLDPYEGTTKTITVYVGDRQAGIKLVRNGVTYWDGLKFVLTEV